ncbi:hypothetical protein FGO68_gene1840 [Halteria grandinella]|uniref:Uncharacterized protein n=1 Tax=Halteria grandinella TaxID=5974 RepID=A0A8J8T1J0_HALGN|nr:hypothetical protein FGO68_gene1840 [Halteria grandinella]
MIRNVEIEIDCVEYERHMFKDLKVQKYIILNCLKDFCHNWSVSLSLQLSRVQALDQGLQILNENVPLQPCT